MKMTDIWIKRFLNVADDVGQWSKDPSTKVGAVIVDQNRRIVSTGYNGLARGVKDSPERLENRDIKYKIILHAEENAILFAKRDLTDCSIFVSSLPPCAHCASIIIQSGIAAVYTWKREIPERWVESMNLTRSMFREAAVDLIEVDPMI